MVNEINSSIHNSISTTGKRSERVETVSADSSKQPAPQPSEAATESIEISSQAQLLSKLEAQIKELPEVDESRIESLREQIQQGTYEIDSSSLAQRIIDLEL